MPDIDWLLIFPIVIGLGLAWIVERFLPENHPRIIGRFAAGVGGVLAYFVVQMLFD